MNNLDIGPSDDPNMTAGADEFQGQSLLDARGGIDSVIPVIRGPKDNPYDKATFVSLMRHLGLTSQYTILGVSEEVISDIVTPALDRYNQHEKPNTQPDRVAEDLKSVSGLDDESIARLRKLPHGRFGADLDIEEPYQLWQYPSLKGGGNKTALRSTRVFSDYLGLELPIRDKSGSVVLSPITERFKTKMVQPVAPEIQPTVPDPAQVMTAVRTALRHRIKL